MVAIGGGRVRIFLATGVTDLRRGFSLQAVIEHALGRPPLNGDIYLFANRWRDMKKKALIMWRHLSLCQSMARHDQGLLLRFRRNLGLRKTAYDWDLPLAAVRRDDSRTDSRRVAAPAQRPGPREDPTAEVIETACPDSGFHRHGDNAAMSFA